MVCRCHDLFCTCAALTKVLPASEQPKEPKLTDDEVLDLYSFLKHGSDEHQEWLLKALFHYFKGTPKPEYKS